MISTPAKAALMAVSVLLGTFLASVVVVSTARRSVADLEIYSQVPEFTLTDQNGQPFASTDMAGTYWVVDFIFTRCPDACPIMSSRLQELYEAFEGSDAVRLLSISVDPDYDTVEVLREYADRLGVTDDRWVFARGPIEEIQRIKEKGFLLAARDLPAGHSTRLVLVDREGQIRGYYESHDDASMKTLKTHVRALVRRER